MSQSVTRKISSGIFWTFGERILAQGVSFFVSIVLARILLPEQYGVVSIVLVFINIANVFVSNGLSEALIQKKNADDNDFSTIFVCCFVLSCGLYVLLFVISPYFAAFYNNTQLIWIVRVLSLKLIISSINSVQHAYVSKHMEFKKFFFSTLSGTVISGIVGIYLALKGAGAWALVAQYLINSTMDTVILLFSVSWKPRFLFKLKSATELLAYGSKMMLSSLINTTYGEIQSLVIGKVYSSSDLAYYKRANQFPSLFITNICTAVSTVLFPAMANETNSISGIKRMTKRSVQITSYLIVPLMLGLIAISKSLVYVLLTEKWSNSIIYLQLLSIAYMFQPIQAANCQAIKAIGRSDIYLMTEVIKKVIGVSLLIYTLNNGVMAITKAFVISVFFSSVITMIPNISLLDYSFTEQLLDVTPAIIIGLIMFVPIYFINYIRLPAIMILLSQISCGCLIYILVSWIVKERSFMFLLRLIKEFRK